MVLLAQRRCLYFPHNCSPLFPLPAIALVATLVHLISYCGLASSFDTIADIAKVEVVFREHLSGHHIVMALSNTDHLRKGENEKTIQLLATNNYHKDNLNQTRKQLSDQGAQ